MISRSRAAWLAGCLGLCALLACAATWPAVTGLGSLTITDLVEPDLQVGVWQPRPFVNWLRFGESPWNPPELVWPHGQDMSRILLNYVIPILLLPIHLLADPLLGLNLAVLACMMLNGLACAWAGRAITGSRLGALVALAVGATSAYAFTEGGMGRMEQSLWAPVAVYLGALVQLRRSPGSRRLILICAAGLAAAGAVYWFYAYFLVVLTALVTLPAALRKQLDRRQLLDLVLVGAGSLVLVLPVLAPVLYNVLSGPDVFLAVWRQDYNSQTQQMRASLMPASYLGPLAWGSSWIATRAPLLLFPACGWAALRGPRWIRPVAWCGLLAGVFAAGPVLVGDAGQPIKAGEYTIGLPMALLNLVLPGFERLWWPYRWIGVATPAFALVAAWAITRLRRQARLALVLFCVWCVVECFFSLRSGVKPGEQLFRRAEVPAVFAELAARPMTMPILQLPEHRLFNGLVGWQAFHQQPISSGLCWHMPGVVRKPKGPGLELRQALALAMKRGAATYRKWTLAQTGGFRLVLYRKETMAVEDQQLAGLSQLLGAPEFEDRQLALWAIDGVTATLPATNSAPPSAGAKGLR